MCTRKELYQIMVMETEVTLALIGFATSITSGIISYRAGKGSRRRDNAEASAAEYESLNKMREFYTQTLEAVDSRMEELNAHDKNSRKKKYILRSIIDWLSGIACKDTHCDKRVSLSQTEIDTITNESSIVEFNIKQDGDKSREDISGQ